MEGCVGKQSELSCKKHVLSLMRKGWSHSSSKQCCCNNPYSFQEAIRQTRNYLCCYDKYGEKEKNTDCNARVIGSASEEEQSSLQEVYHKSITLKEAIKSSLKILKQVMEEKLHATNIELATVQPWKKFRMYTKEELEDVIKDI